MKKRVWMRALWALAGIALACVVAVGCYVGYVALNYERIADGVELACENPQAAALVPGAHYTAVTYNIGFGAYGPDYSFFMDTGVMKDGKAVRGRYGKAMSAEAVTSHTRGAGEVIAALNPDFVLLQEVDLDADRSYHVDQWKALREMLPGYGGVFAVNFDTPYLAYPFHDPHGATRAGLGVLSRYQIALSVRRSYPISDAFPDKFFDLDRCFTVSRLPVEGGGELVLINSHMSAYDAGGVYRERQLAMLAQVMAEEAAKGNYVVAGGDFNHALGAEVAEAFASKQAFPGWVYVLDQNDLPAGIRIQKAGNQLEVPTCRSADIPYEKGVNFVTVVDGFLVSDNVEATAENIDTDFAYSDHNPVLLRFTLKI